MFTNAATATQQTGPVVHTGVTTGATFRYRAGLPVEIRHVNDTYRVFVAGQFSTGWRTLNQAVADANRY